HRPFATRFWRLAATFRNGWGCPEQGCRCNDGSGNEFCCCRWSCLWHGFQGGGSSACTPRVLLAATSPAGHEFVSVDYLQCGKIASPQEADFDGIWLPGGGSGRPGRFIGAGSLCDHFTCHVWERG